jgi:hypothetical protein
MTTNNSVVEKKSVVNYILAIALLIVGLAFVGMGVYRGFYMDFPWWQDIFCQAKIEAVQHQGYWIIFGGVVCILGAVFTYWSDKINKKVSEVIRDVKTDLKNDQTKKTAEVEE